MPRTERDIVIGKVVAPFGMRGELKLVVLTDFPQRFDKGNEVTLAAGEKRREFVIERSSPNKGGITLKLRGVDSRTDAEELRDAEIVIDKAELAKLNGDQFYIFDMIGLKVVTDDGREQGQVTEVLQGGGNDVYVTSTGLCIPALKSVVAGVDLKKRIMVIRPVPGLLPEE